MILKFDIKKTVNYWLKGAEYDLETAEAMLKAKRYPYALFMGHLAVEKLLKALVVKKTENHAPYIHSLPVLAQKLGGDMPEDIADELAGFMEFYQESRYPEEEMEFYKKCTAAFTTENFDEIKKVFKWLKAKL